jgi:hypothetical protein
VGCRTESGDDLRAVMPSHDLLRVRSGA